MESYVLVLLPLYAIEPIQDQKKEKKNTAKQQTRIYTRFTWFDNVPTSTGNDSSSSSHWSWRLQVQYKQQLALISLDFFLFKTSLNHLTHYLPFKLFEFPATIMFSASLSMNNMIKYIYTLDASPRNKDYTLVPKLI